MLLFFTATEGNIEDAILKVPYEHYCTLTSQSESRYFFALVIRMFHFMFLCPQQIKGKINELPVKIDLNKVAYFSNT